MRTAILILALALSACQFGNNNPDVAIPNNHQGAYVGAPGSDSP